MMGNKQTLKRSIGLPLLTLYGMGNILGAGIYVLVGKVAGEAGSGTTLAFIIAMIIAAITAFSYMELSGRYPVSASASIYSFKAFGSKKLSIFIGFAMVLSGIASASALAKGFAGYFNEFIAIPGVIVSILLLIVIGLIAIRGIGESAKAAAIFTIIEVIGLGIIIWIGKDAIAAYNPAEIINIDPALGWAGVFSGAFLAFYAFIGFEDMVNVSEEVKKPRRNMPLAVLFSLIGATILYLLVVIVATSLVSVDDLAASKAPLTLVFESGGYSASQIITIIGMAATVNGVVVQIVMGSRMLYGMSKQKWISPKFAAVNSKYQTPVFATLIVVGLMIAGVILLPIVSLASVTSFLVLGIFAVVNAALMVVKLRNDKNLGYLNIPIFLPFLGVISCIGLIAYQVFSLL